MEIRWRTGLVPVEHALRDTAEVLEAQPHSVDLLGLARRRGPGQNHHADGPHAPPPGDEPQPRGDLERDLVDAVRVPRLLTGVERHVAVVLEGVAEGQKALVALEVRRSPDLRADLELGKLGGDAGLRERLARSGTNAPEYRESRERANHLLGGKRHRPQHITSLFEASGGSIDRARQAVRGERTSHGRALALLRSARWPQPPDRRRMGADRSGARRGSAVPERITRYRPTAAIVERRSPPSSVRPDRPARADSQRDSDRLAGGTRRVGVFG
jgi:hypothetical protein